MCWAGCRGSKKVVMSEGRRAGGGELGTCPHQPPSSPKTSTLAVSPWQGLVASTRAAMELTHTWQGLGGVGWRLQRGWEPGRRDAETQVSDAGLGQGWQEAVGEPPN